MLLAKNIMYSKFTHMYSCRFDVRDEQTKRLNRPFTRATCRDLVKEGFPLHKDYIPALLQNIGDHEQDVIETILAAVTNAR